MWFLISIILLLFVFFIYFNYRNNNNMSESYSPVSHHDSFSSYVPILQNKEYNQTSPITSATNHVQIEPYQQTPIKHKKSTLDIILDYSNEPLSKQYPSTSGPGPEPEKVCLSCLTGF